MAKEIVWTETSVRVRLRIYQFWLSHYQSQIYSDKLEKLVDESAKLIAEFPEIGSITDYKGVRVKVWDTRQEPDEIDLG